MGSINKLVEYIENAPKEFRNLLISALIKGSMAMNNLEQEVFKPADVDDLTNGGNKEQQKRSSNLLESMRRGEYNAQYVKQFYEILRRADDIVLNSTPEEMRQLAERYGMGSAANTQYNMLTEDRVARHGNKTPQQIRDEEAKKRVTKDDNYEVDHMVSNIRNVKNILEAAGGAPKQYEFSLKVSRDQEVVNKIEELSEFLHIKHVGENHKILEFFIPKKYKVTIVEHVAALNELKNFQYVWFTDKYGKRYDYNVRKFYKLSSNQEYDVIKFNAVIMETMEVGIKRIL